MSLYLPFKDALSSIVHSHFPPQIADRFSYRMDDEIWIAKEDEAVFNRKRAGTMSCHVLFDGVHITEIPAKLDRKRAEWWILMGFRDAIKSGNVSFTKVAEFTDNKTIRETKRKLKAQREQALQDSIREAAANPLSETELANMLKDRTEKAKKARAQAKKPKSDQSAIFNTKRR